MAEITNLRTYTSKTFQKGNDLVSQLHVGHIHYKDGAGDLQDVDYRFVDQGTYWEVTKASYKLYVAKDFGAPQLIRFDNRYEGANHSIFYEPHSIWWVNTDDKSERTKWKDAQAVTGTLNADQNKITWVNAFGAGVDFEVTLRRSGFTKEIVINSKPPTGGAPYANWALGVVFGWQGDDLKISDGVDDWNDVHYYERTSTLEVRETGSGLKSYIQKAYGIDSGVPEKRVELPVFFEKKGGSLWQGKLISQSLIENATYPARMDTTTDFYAGSGDGQTGNEDGSGSWDNCHDATSGSESDHTDANNLRTQIEHFGDFNNIRRLYFPIDTSAIPDTDVISAATLYLFVNAKANDDNDGDDFITVVQTFQASNTALVDADYEDCGSDDPQQGGRAFAIPVEGIDSGDRVDITGISTGNYISFPLNATGISWISKTGFTKLGTREGHDVIDSQLADSSSNHINVRPSEYTGTANDPYLEVTYTTGGPTTDSQTAFLKGESSTSGTTEAYLAGSLDTSDSTLAYLVGIGTYIASNQTAYTAGQEIIVSDNTPTYLSGKDTATDSQPAYLRGSIDIDVFGIILDNFNRADEEPIDNSLWPDRIYIGAHAVPRVVGNEVAQSTIQNNTNAYWFTSYNQNQAVFITNTVVDAGSGHAFGLQTRLVSPATSGVNGYLLFCEPSATNLSIWRTTDGGNTKLNEVSQSFSSGDKFLFTSIGDKHTAYIDTGSGWTQVLQVTDSTYLNGGYIGIYNDDSASARWDDFGGGNYNGQEAYLAGSVNIVNSQLAFMEGTGLIADSQTAYLKGINTALDTQSAYVAGKDSITGNVPVYLKGQSSTTSSTNVYLDGMGERLTPDGDISQSGNWKREDDSTSNLYQSIDEFPGANDADYVWRNDAQVGHYFEVSLSDPSFGSIGAGEVKVFWRIKRRAGADTMTLKVELREGATVRASDSKVLTDTDTTYIYTLSSGEKSSIIDWSDLRLRFVVESIT